MLRRGVSTPTAPEIGRVTVRSVYHIDVSGHLGHRRCLCDSPPTWEDLTHLALSGLVDSSNEVWREAYSQIGTDLASVAREFRPILGHLTSVSRRINIVYAYASITLW